MTPESTLTELMSDLLGDRFKSGKGEAQRKTSVHGVDVIPDGIIDDEWIVELESRVLKQVRGAVVDLILSTNRRKKLLVLLAQPGADLSRAVGHLKEVVRSLGQDLNNWCIVGLSREWGKQERLEILRTAFQEAGILRPQN